MTNEVSKVMTFEEKMKERIRESIGDLISDDDLAKIVETGIEQAFFERLPDVDPYGKVRVDNWGRPRTSDPLIHSVVKECLQSSVDEQVKIWFDNNASLVETLVESIIRDGISNIVMQSLNQRFQSSLVSFGQMFRDTIGKM